MKQKLYLVAIALAGATMGLIVAEFAFAAQGVRLPETIALGAFLITWAAYSFLPDRSAGSSLDRS
jgi:hypothetical protein